MPHHPALSRAALRTTALLALAFAAQAQDSSSSGNSADRRRPPGPPPEAVQACAGQAEGATVGFTLKDGKTLTGTCRLVKGRLVATPANMGGKPAN